MLRRETKGGSPIRVERIELCQGALAHHDAAAINPHAVVKCIADLGVLYCQLTVDGAKTVALTIMDGGIGKRELLLVDSRGIDEDTVVGSVNVSLSIVLEQSRKADSQTFGQVGRL